MIKVLGVRQNSAERDTRRHGGGDGHPIRALGTWPNVDGLPRTYVNSGSLFRTRVNVSSTGIVRFLRVRVQQSETVFESAQCSRPNVERIPRAARASRGFRISGGTARGCGRRCSRRRVLHEARGERGRRRRVGGRRCRERSPRPFAMRIGLARRGVFSSATGC